MKTQRTRRTEQGSIMIMSLFVVSLIAVFVATDLTKTLTETRSADMSTAHMRAFHLSEAAVDEAIAALNADSGFTYPYTCPTLALAVSGSATCTVTDQGNGRIRFVASGLVSGRSRAVEIIGERLPGPVFQWALYTTQEHLHLHGDGMVDTYHSANGPYVHDDNGVPAIVATNETGSGALAFGNCATQDFDVWGDVVVGPGVDDPLSNVQTGNYTTIHGTASSAAVEITFPDPTPPAGAPSGASITDCSVTTFDVSSFNNSSITLPRDCEITLVGDGVVHLDDLDVGKNSVVRLQGDIQLSTEALRLRPGGKLQVDSGSTELYVDDRLNIGQGYLVNQTQIPSNMVMFVKGDQRVYLREPPGGGFYGAIYAPEGDIRVKGQGKTLNVFGALIGEHVNSSCGQTLNVHYDLALGEETFSEATLPKDVSILTWRDCLLADCSD